MKNIITLSLLMLLLSCERPSQKYLTISEDILRDKIAGGWAGKMVGVSYGAPSEFVYNGRINEDPIEWSPETLRTSITEDDLYVQMSFMMTNNTVMILRLKNGKQNLIQKTIKLKIFLKK